MWAKMEKPEIAKVWTERRTISLRPHAGRRCAYDFGCERINGNAQDYVGENPTNEMIEREPQSYSKFIDNDYVQPGGPSNPLGARALYLFQNGRDTYFRIHGTTAPESIGRSVSNGCIRMLNEHVIDLYNRVPVGTPVTVL